MSRKIKALEGWYAIDQMLFGDHARNIIKESEDFSEYISLKGSMLANAHELWEHLGYEPKFKQKPKDDSQLQEIAKKTAKHSIALTESLIQKDGIKEKISENIIRESKETPSRTQVREVVQHHYNQMNIDNVILGLPMYECNVQEHDFRGAILEEAHILLRDSLLEVADKYAK